MGVIARRSRSGGASVGSPLSALATGSSPSSSMSASSSSASIIRSYSPRLAMKSPA